MNTNKALQAALSTLQKAGQIKVQGGQYYAVVDYSIIKERAIQILEAQGIVTTLQIKNSLRKDGFYVKQSEVSDLMTDLANDGEVEVTNVRTRGKEHRLFYAPGTPEVIAKLAYATYC